MPDRKVALVTGGSVGLGKLVVQGLAAKEYSVATCARSTHRPAAGEELYRSLDVADPKKVEAFVQEVLDRFHRIDVLVNNAGFANSPSPLQDSSDVEAHQCFEINILGPYSFMKRVLPTMIRQPEGGVVVNVASRAAITPVPGLAAYSASKTALVSLTLAAAKEMRDQRVLLVSVCPSGMKTRLRATVYGDADAERQQEPDKVANLICEIAATRTANGISLSSGTTLLVTKERGIQILQWSRDDRGFNGFGPG